MIVCNEVSVTYQTKAVMQSVKLALSVGSITCLLGPSGCGKTSLLKALMGMLPGQVTGTIHSKNGSIVSLNKWPIEQTTFGLVPQQPQLLPWKSVLQNLTLVGCDEPNALQLLSDVGLESYAHKLPGTLSQGQAARVSFARAIASQCQCILMDEPFAALDAVTRRHLQDWLLHWVKQQKCTLLFVTHDVQEALRIADKIIVLGGSPSSVTYEQTRLQFDANTESVIFQKLQG